MREGLEELLRREGYRVLTAVDGEEGLRIVRENRPHLILLDVALPGMDGFPVTTLDAIRRLPEGRKENSERTAG